jgi:uncharacterized protein YidB (DUF937 family)
MGLLDSVVSMLGNQSPDGTAQSGLLEQVMCMLNKPEIGGLPGLISKFENGGLGEVVSSWVGTGQNAPVSGDQITNTLGIDEIKDIAGKLGMSDAQASNGLASLLPQIIDKLTPDGKVPDGGSLEQTLGSLLQKFTKA